MSMPYTYRNRREARGPWIAGRISDDRLQYWADESEEPGDEGLLTAGPSGFNVFSASLMLVALGTTLYLIKNSR